MTGLRFGPGRARVAPPGTDPDDDEAWTDIGDVDGIEVGPARPAAPVGLVAMLEHGLPAKMVDVGHLASLIDRDMWANAALLDVIYGPYTATDWMVWLGGVVQVIREHAPRPRIPVPGPAAIRVRADALDHPARRNPMMATTPTTEAAHRPFDWLSVAATLIATLPPSSAGKLYEHEVMRRVYDRLTEARKLWVGDVGEAVEQTITVQDAQALTRYYYELRAEPGGDQLPPAGPIVPGRHWATAFGVRLVIEDRAPVLGEQHGGQGAVGLDGIAARMLPAGTTRSRTYGYLWITAQGWANARDREMALKVAKANLAEGFDAPHYIAVLAAEDLTEHEQSGAPNRLTEPGWRMVYGFTAAAIPGRTPYVVFRRSPDLPPQWLHPDREGKWQPRGDFGDTVGLPTVRIDPMQPLDAVEGQARMLNGRATGRVEIRDGQAAEVYEVTL